MGKSAQNNGQSKAGRFAGIGHQKSGRRSNRPNGSPRKVYPYVRREQVGTPMETFINAKWVDLEEQGNSVPLKQGNRMDQPMSTGQLNKDWGFVNRKGMNSAALRDYINKHGVTPARALKKLSNVHEVSFGAEPRSR